MSRASARCTSASLIRMMTACAGLAPAAALAQSSLSPPPTGPIAPPEPRLFTVIGMPDTQNYSEFYPQIYHQQTDWIARNRDRMNINFVSHYGDVVNHGGSTQEWAVARSAMDTLDRANIPYGVAPGNHDITPSGSAGSEYIPQQFLANFGPQRFAGRDWYGGASPSGMSSYQIFRGGGREFISLHLQCDTPVDELVWAQGVLNQNRDKPTMVTTHRYLQDAEDYTGGVPIVPSGRYPSIWYGVEGTYSPGGIQSDEFYNSFVRANQQIFMVNCGHFHEEYRQTSTNFAGLPVHEVLADYQDDPNGGNGFLRIMRFDVAGNRVNVDSYSPTLNQYRTTDESRFTLGVNFDQYAPASPSVSFQNGINGYAAARDTWVSQASPGSSYGNDQTVWVDDDVNNSVFNDRRGQGLLRFDNIFSPSGLNGTIPAGAVIESATLRLVLEDDIDTPLADPDFLVYMMTRDWDENSTWDSLGGGLSQGADFGLFLGSFAGDNSPDADYWRVLDVTEAVRRWAMGDANFGFAILPQIISGNDDGIEFWSTEAANILYRPVLDVRYHIGLVPAPNSVFLLAAGSLFTTRRRRNR